MHFPIVCAAAANQNDAEWRVVEREITAKSHPGKPPVSLDGPTFLRVLAAPSGANHMPCNLQPVTVVVRPAPTRAPATFHLSHCRDASHGMAQASPSRCKKMHPQLSIFPSSPPIRSPTPGHRATHRAKSCQETATTATALCQSITLFSFVDVASPPPAPGFLYGLGLYPIQKKEKAKKGQRTKK